VSETPEEGTATGSGRAGRDTRATTKALFADLRAAEEGSPAHSVARDSLIELHLPLVHHCARRFRNRGEPLEDLVQVGTIGLLKAVDRFDTDRGVEFSTYATPTIVGEIKRHFRDKGWAIRVPRRLQELRQQISVATADLAQELGRSPTPSELAVRLECTVDEVIEGIESGNAYQTLSLDRPDNPGEDGTLTLADSLGAEDDALANVEIRASLEPLLARLEPRERRIVMLRFFAGMTQSQIAGDVGVSQMHVSRLLTRSLQQMRAVMEEAEATAS